MNRGEADHGSNLSVHIDLPEQPCGGFETGLVRVLSVWGGRTPAAFEP